MAVSQRWIIAFAHDDDMWDFGETTWTARFLSFTSRCLSTPRGDGTVWEVSARYSGDGPAGQMVLQRESCGQVGQGANNPFRAGRGGAEFNIRLTDTHTRQRWFRQLEAV